MMEGGSTTEKKATVSGDLWSRFRFLFEQALPELLAAVLEYVADDVHQPHVRPDCMQQTRRCRVWRVYPLPLPPQGVSLFLPRSEGERVDLCRCDNPGCRQ